MAFQKIVIEKILYPAMERFKGNRIREELKALEASEQEDRAATLRTERLTELLLHVKQHVPAYRELPATEEEIRQDPWSVLRNAVPLLPKRSFQQAAEQHLADNIPEASRIANHTGGSTGEPIHFFMTRQQVERYEAARWRGLGWYGITPGSRSVMIWGNPVELSRQKQLVHRLRESLLKNRRIISAYDLTPEKIRQYVRELDRYRPEYLYGYAGALATFAKMMEQQGLSLRISLKAVVSTSETLEPWQEELLGRVFGCAVANEYGARDAGILAYRCPQGGMHITAENCILEVLDPITHAPLPDGESGLLAITDLTNFVQPRLRYLLGDVAALSTKTCACGRTLPLLTRIEGREDDLLIGRGGALVHGHVIAQYLLPVAGVSGCQFRQHTPTTATLYLVKTDPSVVVNEQEILSQLAKTLPDTAVRIVYVPEIRPSASGKIRYAVRECPLS